MSPELTLLTWPDYLAPATAQGFEAVSGWRVRFEIVPGAVEMVERIRQGDGEVDLLCPPDYGVRQLAAEGRLLRLDHDLLPNRVNLDPQFRGRRRHDPGDVYSIPKDWGTTGYLVRTDHIPEPGDSWRDFWALAAAHPGRVTVLDSSPEVIGAALKMRGRSYNAVDPPSLDQALVDLTTLRPGLLAITTDYRPRLAAGEAWLSLGWNGDAAALQRDGVPVRYVLPAEGSQIWEDDWAIAAGAPHPEAAHAFLDYVLQGEVAAAEARYTGYATANLDALARLAPETRDDPSVYPPPQLRARLEQGTPLPPDGARRRAELWSQFKGEPPNRPF